MLVFMTLMMASVHAAEVATNMQSSMAAKLRHLKVLCLGLRCKANPNLAVRLHRPA